MIKTLFSLYRNSPYPVRETMSKMTGPLRFAMQPFRKIKMDGYHMYLDFYDNASFKYFNDKQNYERLERSYFAKLIALNPGSTVIDIGAHYGAYTLLAGYFSELGLVKKVIAIEPDPKPYDSLKNSLEKNKWSEKVTLLKNIIGEKKQTTKLFVNARSSSDNRTHQVESAPIRVKNIETIEATTIDSILEEHDIDFSSSFIIKMDIQGNEPRAFHGMQKLLEQAQRFAILFEYSPALIRSAGNSIDAFISFLSQIPFTECYEFSEQQLKPILNHDAFRLRLREVEGEKDSRYQGATTDFLILKNMNFF